MRQRKDFQRIEGVKSSRLTRKKHHGQTMTIQISRGNLSNSIDFHDLSIYCL